MKRDAAEILKDALALPTEARAALAGSLLESLDTEVDEDAEAAWATEVNRRVAELDSGAVNTIPWAEVRRRLAHDANRSRQLQGQRDATPSLVHGVAFTTSTLRQEKDAAIPCAG
jgi:putative addiction module component (TIGR02574 family)